jgi:LacI family transcriptional regulator
MVNGLKRKRIAIVTSFHRLGQWRGIMRFGQFAGWICQRHDRESLDRLAAWKPDGILFQVDEFDQPLLDYVRETKVPRVGLRALHGQEQETPLILPDLADFARQIAEHFVASNYRRICYLGPHSDFTANAANTHVRGLRRVAEQSKIALECIFPDQEETWRKLGLPYQENHSTGWHRFWELGPALIDHLLADPEPVALFSAYVEPAMEFMEMVDEREVAIPDRIGMAAQTEDALNGTVTKVPLTCIVPDFERQGYEAAALLDQILKGHPVRKNFRKFIKAGELFARESSNQIVTADPLVREMMDHLRKHALRADFTPSALADAFRCSLRLVQLRFHTSLGRGVAEVIREFRTRRAADLILNSKIPMQQIVSDCGYSDHHQLARSIRKEFGKTPSELRRSVAGNN